MKNNQRLKGLLWNEVVKLMAYIAHKTEDNREQPLIDHLKGTAELCRSFAIDDLKDYAYFCGLIHDIGKYSNAFQERIRGKNIKVEHALSGAQEIAKLPMQMWNFMLEYCIAGHHSGLPDGGTKADSADMATLHGILKRRAEDYFSYKNEVHTEIPDNHIEKILKKCRNCEELIEVYAFLTRYIYSCLTDADFIDTEHFVCPYTDRMVTGDFRKAYERVCAFIDGFKAETILQKSRGDIQKQVYKSMDDDSDIYTINMPTGSGKTLCSIRAALEMAIEKDKKRIIYVIPYVSIIEQTAEIFNDIFGDVLPVIQHQSNFDFDREDQDENALASEKIKKACENWDAPLIVTTNIQFFESLYNYRSSRLRKLHNLSNSIVIFDEVHMLPSEYIQPCIKAIGYITKFIGSKALLMSATMPDYSKFINEYTSDCKVTDAVPDKSLFRLFSKCTYNYIGRVDLPYIYERSQEYGSSLIIVNRRKTARELYNLCSGKKYHLSTYMTPQHRSEVISSIRQDLKTGEKLTVISTSLIEAGVDLDFETVFRENAGIDNIIQSGGRCNREGKRKNGDVFVFETDDCVNDIRANITRSLFEEYDDITSDKCIQEYYKRIFKVSEHQINKNTIVNIMGNNIRPDAIPFREYAQSFKFIDNEIVGIVIPNEENQKLIDELKTGSFSVKRKLQQYCASVRFYEFEEMVKLGLIDRFDCGVYVLNNTDYYSKETGLMIEQQVDYIL